MIDISGLPILFLQIPLLILVILGIFSGFKDGIVKKLIDTAFYIILIILMTFFVPPLARQLESSGYIQNIVMNNVSGELAETLTSILTGPAYIVLTSAIVFLVVIVIKFFVNFFLNKLFKKGMINRGLGAVWQLTINLIISGFIMVVIASPSIFKGGHELLSSTPGVKQVYGGVCKVQEVLKEKNLPYDLESVFGKYLAGKGATSEDVERYKSTLERLPSILESVSDGSFVDNIVDTNGEINQEYASNLVDDFIVFSELVNKLPEEQKAQVSQPLLDLVESGKDQIIDSNGEPVATIEVTEEQKTTLNEACTNLGVDASVLEDLNKCLVIK